MHGNVWEWGQDGYMKYTSGTAVDPAGLSSGSFPGKRGGGWQGSTRNCRSAHRSFLAPGDRVFGDLGFRLLRVAQ